MANLPDVLVTAVSHGATAIASFWIALKTSKRDDFSAVVTVLKEDNATLRDRIVKMEERITSLEDKLDAEKNRANFLDAQIRIWESAHQYLPIPQWLKAADGRMLALNKAYEDAFLIPIGKKGSNYIGLTDREFWGEEIGAEYETDDNVVRITGETKIFKETIILDGVNVSDDWIIMKYNRKIDGAFVGVGGIAFPISKALS